MIIAAESVPELNARTDLPGYSEAASLDAILAKSQPVGSFVIATESSNSSGFDILTGVRKPDQPYPWAMSIATCEIPREQAGVILSEATHAVQTEVFDIQVAHVPDDEQRELSPFRVEARRYAPVLHDLSLEPTEGESQLVTMTRAMLVRKFDLLERTRGLTSGVIGTVSLHDVTVGFVGAGSEGRIEYNTNFCIAVNTERELFGGDTEGYLSNNWVNPEGFMAGFLSHDLQAIDPNLDETSSVYLCNRGQCLRSAVAAMQEMDFLRQHLGIAA